MFLGFSDSLHSGFEFFVVFTSPERIQREEDIGQMMKVVPA